MLPAIRGGGVTHRGHRAWRIVAGLTVGRIVSIPVIMALVLHAPERPGLVPLAAGVFALAAVTDFLDGRLARRWDVATTIGSFLDTTADKLLVTGTLIALVAIGQASAWVAAIIVGRELVILALRGVVASGGAVMAPSIWGKLKANVQFVAILVAILRPPVDVGPLLLDEWLMVAAAVVTVASAVDYLKRFAGALSVGTDR